MTENKLIRNESEAIECLKKNKPTSGFYMLQESVDIAIQALEEVQQYHAIGTVEECKRAVEKVSDYEKQYLDDTKNPLEPLKVSSALDSELFKLNYRMQTNPKSINILDYTVIAALQKALGVDWSEGE